jgi:hypothetical protein
MKKLVVCFIILLIPAVVYGQVFKSGDKFDDEDSLNEWICEYHRNLNPELLVDAILALAKLEMIGYGYPEKDAFAAGFISAIFSKHPDRIDGWLNELKSLPFPGPMAIVWKATALSNTKEANNVLEQLTLPPYSPQIRKFAKQLLSTPLIDFLTEPIECYTDCDHLWGRYFATGDRNCIVKIIGALGLADQTQVWDTKAEAAAYAKNFLIVYAAKYPEVMDICEEELNNQPENIKQRLAKVIERAQNFDENEGY